ncbi:MAG: FMN-binding protein [Bacillota bacterium]|nr:FMN-binding protein [Bacillota bacterium]HHT89776.1 FMN-binding protein [Bacillota bacterium]
MLTVRTRTSVSLVLFIGLLLVSAVVWSMAGQDGGVYAGTAQGFGGPLTVDVTISDGKIMDVTVRPHEETPFIADEALKTLTESVLESQSANVEIVSGATYTSKAFIAAVEQALFKASLEDGTYSGAADGFGGPLKVTVTVAGGSITAVEIVEQSETPFIAGDALEQIPAAIVADQGWNVDVLSGATVTSQAIMRAVENALTN